MTIQRGFYRHRKGHAYYVHGVACDPHDGNRRIVIYTSVKTEEEQAVLRRNPPLWPPPFDFLARDEYDFEIEVDAVSGERCDAVHDCVCSSCAPRFKRVTDPEKSRLP